MSTTQTNYELSKDDMLALVDERILSLEGFIAVNASVRDNLLEQGLDMSNLDEYLVFMDMLDRRKQALLQKRDFLENQE